MFRENIGENLREIRKKDKTLSVVKIVDRMNEEGYGLSVDTYYKWERGTRKPPCDAIPFLAQALGVSESRLFHLHKPEEERPETGFPEVIYASMGKRDQKLIADLMIRLQKQETMGQYHQKGDPFGEKYF